MHSLRTRLFVIMIVATGVVWASAAIWIWYSTRGEVERVLDARLMEAARMVSSLVDSQEIGTAVASLDRSAGLKSSSHSAYERQLSCQIWSLSGALVGRSDGAPETRLSDHPSGFAEREIDGETWRVYAVRNEALGVQVLVGDNLTIRSRIVADMLKGLAIPMVLVLPALALILWFGAGRGLSPLGTLANGLERRQADDFEIIAETGAAAEIRPVVHALNGLFARVAASRDRERQFLAYAAHELRTPLSGLKTQAEIALKSDRPEVRRSALERMSAAVDRTARLVRQLLAMAEAEGIGPRLEIVMQLDRFFSELLVEPSARLAERGGRLIIDDSVRSEPLRVDKPLLALAICNLVENAVAHSPDGGAVTILAKRGRLIVEDEGTGFGSDDLHMAKDRFYRGSKPVGVGSGLGLTIAEIATRRMDAQLLLSNGPNGGARAEICFADKETRVGGRRKSTISGEGVTTPRK